MTAKRRIPNELLFLISTHIKKVPVLNNIYDFADDLIEEREDNDALRAENERMKTTMREAVDNCDICHGISTKIPKCARCQTFIALIGDVEE